MSDPIDLTQYDQEASRPGSGSEATTHHQPQEGRSSMTDETSQSNDGNKVPRPRVQSLGPLARRFELERDGTAEYRAIPPETYIQSDSRSPMEVRVASWLVQSFPLDHTEWTADQWFWRWLDLYGQPTYLDEALSSAWVETLGEQAVRDAHARLLLLGVTR